MNQQNQLNQNKLTEYFTAIFRIVIAVFMLFFLGSLFMQAFVSTTDMEFVTAEQAVSSVVQYIRPHGEGVNYHQDNVLANLIFLVIGFLAVWLFTPKHLSLRVESVLIAVWTIGIGILWVSTSQVAPTTDSEITARAAMNFANGNYELLTGEERYFRNYSFQLGFVFFEEILIRIAYVFQENLSDLIFIQKIFAVLLASAYVAILHMLDLICEDKRIRHTAFLMLIFCVQPILTCSFLYGIIPGFAFTVWAIYFEIKFLKSDSWKSKLLFGILSALCITISVIIKSNNLIVLVAMALLAGVTAFQTKKTLCNLLLVVVCVIPCATVPDAVITMYEKRANTELGDSIPIISWIAMGMCEGDSAPGWYRGDVTVDNFAFSGFDAAIASERSKELIRDRIAYFQENKQYRNDFFAKKYLYMWNETTYQCIWHNTARGQYNPKTGIAKFICEEKRAETKRYTDYFSQLVFVGCFFGIIYCLKKKNTYLMLMPLIVLGGMLYHLLAEAKSQYALPYFIWMTVFAACGFVFLIDWLKPHLCIQNTKKSEILKNPVDSSHSKMQNKIKNGVNKMDILYLVIPCYNEEAVLPETSKQLKEKMVSLIQKGEVSEKSRILFVNDGSKDKTWEMICQLHQEDPLFQGVCLSRNRGHQNALLAGLMTAKDHCDISISLDADLQDDINAIDDMVRQYHKGFEVVYGVRNSRETDTFFKKTTAEGYYKVMKLLGADLVFNHADYRLMSKRALESLASFKENNLFLRGIVPMIGYSSTNVYYARKERFAGESKYPLKKMLAFAWEGVTSLSVKPIHTIMWLGAIVFLVSLVILIWSLVRHAMGETVAGWTSTIVSIWAIGGLQLLAIGMIGEYVGKIYLESKERPRYIISEYLGDEENNKS